MSVPTGLAQVSGNGGVTCGAGGVLFKTTNTLVALLQPFGLVTVTLYVPGCVTVAFTPDTLDTFTLQAYTPPPVGVSTTLWVAQVSCAGALILAVGKVKSCPIKIDAVVGQPLAVLTAVTV